MDGNGRWAKKRLLPRIAGHRAGFETVRKIVTVCAENKIEVLTLFAFSSENWRRPEQEVNFLMDLFVTGLQRESQKLHEQNVRLRIIGDYSQFNKKLQDQIIWSEQLTAKNTGLTLQIAANYGGQWDLCEAFRKIAIDVEHGNLSSKDITPELIQSKLSFSDLPDPDLFIRTSGEQRISNFMLWQLSYTELYFTETLWPDFDGAELMKAFEFYQSRERRFGCISEQVQSC